MKILIVTVYNSENCGSYLQAFALSEFLKAQGHEVAFLKRQTKGTSHDFREHFKSSLRLFFSLRIKPAIKNMRLWSNFQRSIKRFSIVDLNSSFYKECELVVIGSDTVWNFDSHYFTTHAKIFCGEVFRGKQVITYAASLANTSIDRFKQVTSDGRLLSNVTTCLVRDENTLVAYETTTRREADLVCDPTLLVNKETFYPLMRNVDNKPYLLIYCFGGKIEDSIKKSIVGFSRKNNLQIISMTVGGDWVTLVDKTPENMITYFSNASFVVTDTFHGTAFTILYNIPFAVIDKGKKKVKDLLSTYNQVYRLFSESDRLSEILNKRFSEADKKQIDVVRNNSEHKLSMAMLRK